MLEISHLKKASVAALLSFRCIVFQFPVATDTVEANLENKPQEQIFERASKIAIVIGWYRCDISFLWNVCLIYVPAV